MCLIHYSVYGFYTVLFSISFIMFLKFSIKYINFKCYFIFIIKKFSHIFGWFCYFSQTILFPSFVTSNDPPPPIFLSFRKMPLVILAVSSRLSPLPESTHNFLNFSIYFFFCLIPLLGSFLLPLTFSVPFSLSDIHRLCYSYVHFPSSSPSPPP